MRPLSGGSLRFRQGLWSTPKDGIGCLTRCHGVMAGIATFNLVLVASEAGVAVTYGLLNAQGRGDTFIEPGAKVYEGMIIGSQRRGADIPINVCKEKQTNIRSSTADIAKRLNATVA